MEVHLWSIVFYILVFICSKYAFNLFITKEESVKGKVILITGASSGIGKSIAERYAKKGAILALVARRKEELDAVCSYCKQLGAPQATGIVADVSVQGDCKRMINETIDHFGSLDILVLNAGISMGILFQDISEPDLTMIKKIMDVNYYGAVYPTYYAIPHLVRSSGKIAVISSVLGKVAMPSRSGYAASKFALHGFFDSLRREFIYNHQNVQVTMICPGAVATDINRTRLGDQFSLNMEGAMSADEAAKLIDIALGSKMNELILVPTFRIVPWLQMLIPKIFDRLVVRQTRKLFSRN